METLTYGFIASILLLYGLISNKIESSFLTGPIIFMGFGYLLSGNVLGYMTAQNHLSVYVIAHITLILILFSDASRINLSLFRKDQDIPRRLLGLGLPLTIVFGVACALWVFIDLPFWQAAVLATTLAPTDAALVQGVINSKRVPLRIRQSLNVESGLNDGICFPILLLFISLADSSSATDTFLYWMTFIGLQLFLGPVIGIIIGFIGGKLVLKAVNNDWMTKYYQRLSLIALSFMAFFFADHFGGNGFIAAFTAGLLFGHVARSVLEPIYIFGETEGEFFIMLTFLFFGAILIPNAIENMSGRLIVYGVLSLTVVRMIPVALSLIGKKLSRASIMYLGWFGPRGAASILYLILVVSKYSLSQEELIFNAATVTIMMSVLFHGLTAVWGSKIYVSMLRHDKEGSIRVK